MSAPLQSVSEPLLIELRRIADVVDKYQIPSVKVTGGQRIDLFGARLEEQLAKQGVKVVDATDIIDAVKCIKSAEEIEIVRRCCAMQDEVMRRVAGHIKPGMKDFEVYAYAQYQGQLLGSENGIFLGSSATPPEPDTARRNAATSSAMLRTRLSVMSASTVKAPNGGADRANLIALNGRA